MKVDLLLVNPGNRLEQFAGLNTLATVAQPLGLAMLAAYARERGLSVDIVDAEANFWSPEQTIEELVKYDPVLIGLSAFTTKMTSAGRILKLIRDRMPGVKTVIGAHHASAIPECTLREEAVDFVIQGEGFIPLVALTQRLKNCSHDFYIPGVWYMEHGHVVGHGRSAGITRLDDLPIAAWDLLPMEKYRAHHWQAWDYNLDQSGYAVFYTSLGCPYSCQYCSVNVVYGYNSTRYRSAASVVRELSILVGRYHVKHVELIDDTFTTNQKRVESICDGIIEAGLGDKLNMWCFARTDRVSLPLMQKMKRAGIHWVFMGFESGDDTVLKGVNKGQTVGDIREAARIVHEAGIHIGGNYVFGLPTDTQETMKETLALAKELNTEYANFFMMMAYPGTQLYKMAKAKGYELPRRWGQYGFFAPDALPLRNDNLTSDEILTFRDKAFTEYFNGRRYQDMVREQFGQHVLNYLNTQVLSKQLVRTVRPGPWMVSDI